MAFRGWAFGVMDQFVIRAGAALPTIAEQYLSMNAARRFRSVNSATSVVDLPSQLNVALRTALKEWDTDTIEWIGCLVADSLAHRRADLAASVRR